MSKLFKIEKLKKFFSLLEDKGRESNNRYLGWSKSNPHIAYCEKQVFVERLSDKLLPSRYLKLYNIASKTVQYLYILRVEYYLGWGEELEIYYIDYSRSDLGIQSKKLHWNDIIRLEGQFLQGEEHKIILDLFKLHLPEKTYRFLAYDFDKYPKRVKKGTDPKEKIKTYIDIQAITDEDAMNKRSKHNRGKLMVTEDFEIINILKN